MSTKPGPSSDEFFCQNRNSWLIIDVDAAFPKPDPIKAHGTHAIAYTYWDHQEGITIHIWGFLVFSSDGYPRMTWNLKTNQQIYFLIRHGVSERPYRYPVNTHDDGGNIIVRHGPLAALRLRRAAPSEIHDLDLASILREMNASSEAALYQAYNRPEWERFRRLDWLFPHHFPFFPDDVPAHLPIGWVDANRMGMPEDLVEIFNGEIVWVRLERLREDGTLEGNLLSNSKGISDYARSDVVLLRRIPPAHEGSPILQIVRRFVRPTNN